MRKKGEKTEKKRNREDRRKRKQEKRRESKKKMGREEKVSKNVAKKRNRDQKEFTKMGHEGMDMSSPAHAQHSLKQERSNNIDNQFVQL